MMDFLSQMCNDGRFHEIECLLLALLQTADPEVLTCSLGEIPIESIVEKLEKRVEANISRNLQHEAEKAANDALGRRDPFELFFGKSDG